MNNLAHVLVGVTWTLIFADAALTLHGLRSGKVIERNRLMRWFVKSPWRIYPLSCASCACVYLVANVLTVWAGWPWGAVFCVPLIVQRAVIVRNNYRLNVKVW